MFPFPLPCPPPWAAPLTSPGLCPPFAPPAPPASPPAVPVLGETPAAPSCLMGPRHLLLCQVVSQLPLGPESGETLFLAEQPPLPASLPNGTAAPAAKATPTLIKVQVSSRLPSFPFQGPSRPCCDFVPVQGTAAGSGVHVSPRVGDWRRSLREVGVSLLSAAVTRHCLLGVAGLDLDGPSWLLLHCPP